MSWTNNLLSQLPAIPLCCSCSSSEFSVIVRIFETWDWCIDIVNSWGITTQGTGKQCACDSCLIFSSASRSTGFFYPTCFSYFCVLPACSGSFFLFQIHNYFWNPSTVKLCTDLRRYWSVLCCAVKWLSRVRRCLDHASPFCDVALFFGFSHLRMRSYPITLCPEPLLVFLQRKLPSAGEDCECLGYLHTPSGSLCRFQAWLKPTLGSNPKP